MNKTALVTGASRGIGRATAERMLTGFDEVDTLVMVARPSADYTALRDRLEALETGKRIVAIELDVADREALREGIGAVFEQTGSIHYLVNNAGYTNPVPIHQVEFEDFQRTIAVNLYAPFILVQELLHLGNTFDLIVNVASTAGINGRAGWLTYSASKAAVINMSEVMREELAIYGTRVVCISPGRTATALRSVLAPDEDPTTIMQPSHVAQVIETLASPVGRFLDSENLVVRQ